MPSRPEHIYADVLVIGNGFDLDLGLPTSCDDFLSSNDFAGIERSGNRFAEYLRRRQNQQRWVDIELELAVYSTQMRGQFLEDYQTLCRALSEYICGLDYSTLDKKAKAATVLEELVAESKELCIVNFNYSRSLEMFEIDKQRVNVIHVHGRAKDNKIVFGVHDRARIAEGDIFLRKSAAPSFFDDCLISSIMRHAYRSVTVFGHSLGESDHSQFEAFFNPEIHHKESKLRIHYHSKNGYYDLMQQIEKMSRTNLLKFRTTHDFQMVGDPLL